MLARAMNASPHGNVCTSKILPLIRMLFGVAALYGLGWNLEELGFIMVTASIEDDCFDSGKRNDQSLTEEFASKTKSDCRADDHSTAHHWSKTKVCEWEEEETTATASFPRVCLRQRAQVPITKAALPNPSIMMIHFRLPGSTWPLILTAAKERSQDG
ncbi:hypothetical protein B296_00034803 [Ensete ventricosum]|uniref:Uncharacterized protein n=1 Tax=Ensete ventricosum TaxID=4639 RepID=A0A426Y7M6_ENSVE|nr:hypothetical protein B296_00034803 [Ensete ventricosum]